MGYSDSCSPIVVLQNRVSFVAYIRTQVQEYQSICESYYDQTYNKRQISLNSSLTVSKYGKNTFILCNAQEKFGRFPAPVLGPGSACCFLSFILRGLFVCVIKNA